MASECPTWLNEDLFKKVVRNVEGNESIKVANVIARPALGEGENHFSDMYRVRVEYSNDPKGQEIAEIYLVVKITVCGDFREDMIKAGDFFVTEISMMSTTLPRMNTFLDKIGLTKLSARFFHAQLEEPAYLILEDLKQKSFEMADRRAGLDLDHCTIALRKLATFHASSVALREEDPKAVTKYWKGWIHSTALCTFIDASAKNLGVETAKWPELSPRISEKIIKLSDVLSQKAVESAVFREKEFNVLNHGDFWTNNMMFSYDNRGKPTEMVLVDFQLNRYCSPALDLLHFFGTSPCDNVRKHNREFLLHEYHASLSSTMEKLKCTTKAPSFDELQQMMKERAFWEVMCCFFVLPNLLVEKKDEIKFSDQMQADGTCDNPGYRDKKYRKVMTRLLPFYDSLGLLDL